MNAVKTVNNLNNNSKPDFLPTQLSQPQWWEGRKLSLLPLRPSERAGAKAQKSWWSVLFGRSALRQMGLVIALLILSIFGYYLVSRYVATTVIVQGRSMYPTLDDGDRFILNRLSYFNHTPKRGDLVVVKDPGHNDYAVKRIVAMPCESLYFKGGNFMVNGKHLLEPYLPDGTQTFLPDAHEKLLVVARNHYFVLGDNRANSEDSRYYGAVDRSQIIGSISK